MPFRPKEARDHDSEDKRNGVASRANSKKTKEEIEKEQRKEKRRRKKQSQLFAMGFSAENQEDDS